MPFIKWYKMEKMSIFRILYHLINFLAHALYQVV